MDSQKSTNLFDTIKKIGNLIIYWTIFFTKLLEMECKIHPQKLRMYAVSEFLARDSLLDSIGTLKNWFSCSI